MVLRATFTALIYLFGFQLGTQYPNAPLWLDLILFAIAFASFLLAERISEWIASDSVPGMAA